MAFPTFAAKSVLLPVPLHFNDIRISLDPLGFLNWNITFMIQDP